MLTEYKAVLFDMDGTLIDSKPVIELAWTTVANKYGVSISADELEQHIHGRSGNYTLSYLFGHFSENKQKLIKQEVDLIEEEAPTELIPGAKSILEYLKNNGIKIGLVTASWPKRINFILDHHKLRDYFSCVVSRDDVINSKPDPEGFLLGAKKLEVPIEQCMVFEDSFSGLEAGIKSGAQCIGINTSTTPKSNQLLGSYTSYVDMKEMLAMDELTSIF